MGIFSGEMLVYVNNNLLLVLSVNMRISLYNEVFSIMKDGDENWWVDFVNFGIKFIDDEGLNNCNLENLDNMVGIICDFS